MWLLVTSEENHQPPVYTLAKNSNAESFSMSWPHHGYVAGSHLFAQSNLSDAAAGAILLVLALVILCLCLFFIVKILHSMLKGKMAKVIKKVNMGMLTHWDPVTYIYLGELDHLWFSWWLDLNHCLLLTCSQLRSSERNSVKYWWKCE